MIALFTRPRIQATIAAVLAAALWWWLRGAIAASVLGLALALAALAWVSPRAHAPVQRLLERLGHAFAVLVSWILLAAVYLGVFVPLRGWRTLSGRDPLLRRADPGASSYLRPLPPARVKHFERMY